MPITPTYPGVYIEEIPSGVRTIVGVATSITAFIGTAFKGPVNEPVRIQNFGDFERQFGGLSIDSTMSYAIQQFFLNGGSDALVVRVANPGVRATTKLKAGNDTLTLEAVQPGSEGEKLKATVSNNGADNFNLIIKKDTETVATINDIKPDEVANRLKADESASKVVRVKGQAPGTRPDAVTDQAFSGSRNPGVAATISLPRTTKDSQGTETKDYLVLEASSEGEWGNNLQAIVDYDTADSDDKELFNLTVRYVDGEQIAAEKIRNISINSSSTRYVVDVLKVESSFVRVANPAQTIPGRPDETTLDRDGNPPSDQLTGKGSNGDPLLDDSFYVGQEGAKTGIFALEKADLFNLLCIPPVNRDKDISSSTWSQALAYCKKRRAILLVDPPSSWRTAADVTSGLDNFVADLRNENAVLYFPRVKIPDPLKENRLEEFPPSAVLAGVMARTDAARGVWKAPAGIDAVLNGVRQLTDKLTDGENGQLNPLGVNCLRTFPVYGNIVWGARTLKGADRLASEWKYLPVRRLTLFLQESLYRGTQWVVFEPNDEPLWSQIRLNVGAFMNNLFRQGAFQGKTPKEAYFVKCDSETTTQNDINLGIVNIIVGFAPLKPAEFVIIKFQQIAGQIAT
ncbi:hypothetical protein NIES2100_46600 [Calothrix sp. NIES-2100]|uniref:phage tail sheath subtilisin-like domain-containing protein n=1 Tax=Calothrix sp. NIES-2100 TaxID=1954172 RepID=UPI000B5FE902|nr:hypothetical protein NIES2100_46600 [Calothrix sp. NIES-2100]